MEAIPFRILPDIIIIMWGGGGGLRPQSICNGREVCPIKAVKCIKIALSRALPSGKIQVQMEFSGRGWEIFLRRLVRMLPMPKT